MLLPKQVHLQKEVGAVSSISTFEVVRSMVLIENGSLTSCEGEGEEREEGYEDQDV